MSAISNNQPNISNVPKKDADGKPIPDTSEGTLVRIRLFDDRERVLLFKDNPSPTTRQVTNMIAQKLELSEDAKPLFSLWIVGNELELQLRPKMEIMEMVDKWPRWVEKYTHANNPGVPPYKFVYKREAMVNRDLEKSLTDEVAIKLLYGEARNNIMSGRYPLQNVQEAVRLAAMQLLISHGDYNSEKHGPGTGYILQSLAIIVPKYMLTKLKNQEWESKIAAIWSTLHKKSQLISYKEFMDYVIQWDFYGSTFFAACKNVPPQGFFELRTDHLLVGVNRNGISIVDEDRHKILWFGNFEGLEWECTPDSLTLEYRPPPNPDGTPKKKMASTIITPQSHLVDSLASRSIYLIEKAEKLAKKKPAVVQQTSQKRFSGTPDKSAPERKLSLKPDQNVAEIKKSIKLTDDGENTGNNVKTTAEQDDRENPAEYLKAVNAARKAGK